MLREHLIGVAREHYMEMVHPVLLSEMGGHSAILVSVVTGSVSYGFCDEFSDVDVTVYLDKTRAHPDSLIHRMFFHCRHASVGVSYYFTRKEKLAGLLCNDMCVPWTEFTPCEFFDLTRFVAIYDPQDAVTRIKERCDFYPPEELTKIVRGLWVTVNVSGLLKARKCLSRGERVVAQMLASRGLEALLRLIYMLNRSYFPYTKWLSLGLGALENTFGFPDQSGADWSVEQQLSLLETVSGNIGGYLLAEGILESECVSDISSNLHHELRIFAGF